MPAQLAFAKVTATPTKNSWCLSYNAGNLFAALSISSKDLGHPSSEIGKSFVNSLEAEFFSLEEKSYKAIKEAITTACSELPPESEVSASFAYNKEGALYVYAIDHGAVLLSRGENQGTLVRGEGKELIGASGILQANDIIVLGTKGFFHVIPPKTLTQSLSLQLPSDMVESLTPLLQEKETGEEAGLFLKFSGDAQLAPPSPEIQEEVLPPSASSEKSTHSIPTPLPEKTDESPFIPSSASRIIIPSDEKLDTHEETLGDRTRTSHFAFLTTFLKTRFLFIGLALLIVFAIIGLIYQTKTHQYNTEVKAVYEEIYKAAVKDVEEAESLLTLNKTLAHDGFEAAKKRLEEITPKLKKDSPEAKQATELVAKIDGFLTETGDGKTLSPTEEELSTNDLLQIVSEKSATAYAQDAGFVYLLKPSEITKIDKNNSKETSIIKKDEDWTTPVAMSVYLGNVYLLDRENGMIKYTAGSSGFGKSAYFQNEESPTLSSLNSFTIDGSIWLLEKDGNILKYTKGVKDSFSLSGLSKLPTDPTLIRTTVEGETLYVLDPKNSQFLLFDKSGSFKTSLQAEAIRNTKEFTIDEKEKKIFFLSNKKLYSVPLP